MPRSSAVRDIHPSFQSSTSTPPSAAPRAARVLVSLLRRLQTGTLDVQWPDGSMARFAGSGASDEPRAAIRLTDWSACTGALKSGDIGFAESFIAGGWTSPDMVALLQLVLLNRQAMEAVIQGSWWGSMLHRLKHRVQRNSRRGSRRNVHAHYDLGNPFYRLWLDPTMTYSSGLFDGDLSKSTEQAQLAKMRRALQACGVQPGQRLLEIGCGWGSLAHTAAADYQARVTGITLSTEQLQWARERIEEAGLSSQVELALRDYRDLRAEPFDAIVSIEMFEAVGHEYWGDFFDAVRRCLKSGGHACIQTITIRDELFESYRRTTDFIQQYIFPGGLLPSAAAFRAHAERSGLEVVDELAFGTDYAETLKRWREAFLSRDAQVRRLGFDSRFMRIWEFYLAYCEAAFATGNTQVFQFTLRRP